MAMLVITRWPGQFPLGWKEELPMMMGLPQPGQYDFIYFPCGKRKARFWCWLYMAVCQNRVPLVNIKIAGKWMFIPLKMVLIGIDPYPYPLVTRGSLWQGRNIALAFINFTSHLAATWHGEIAKLATFLRWLESECSRMFQNENPRIWGLIISSVCFLNCQYLFSMLPGQNPEFHISPSC